LGLGILTEHVAGAAGQGKSLGTWAVLYNAYKVPKEGCTVTVTVEYTKTQRWLKGDLHTHCVNSDGKFY
jgi:hypothetical protein